MAAEVLDEEEPGPSASGVELSVDRCDLRVEVCDLLAVSGYLFGGASEVPFVQLVASHPGVAVVLGSVLHLRFVVPEGLGGPFEVRVQAGPVVEEFREDFVDLGRGLVGVLVHREGDSRFRVRVLGELT
ncbi:hypothetical protein [Agromyces humi]|uniref:hypothetical protein n=1 Tax=Agromyces humi TaxID=1766800 RepID=UPI001359222B|nr:hypothetical protein [Agromyces humi]